jgi:oligopeptide/dipeptide ABC transporter ATP-binding protein
MRRSELLDVSDLSIVYESRRGNVRALDSVTLTIKPKELVAVVGESGCGKSTLGLSIIGLLQTPPAKHVSGTINYRGKSLLDLPSQEARQYRGTEIAMIFQEPMSSLNPVYKVSDQIGEAIAIRESRNRSSSNESSKRQKNNIGKHQPSNRKKDIMAALEMVRIPDPGQVVDRYPFELSGGMRQRIMIAMALSQKPSLLIADEPTTALDVTTQAQVLKLMRGLMDEVSTSILLITHDLALASQVADRVAVMYGGQVVEVGDVYELFSEPLHPYTRGLLQCIPSGSKVAAKLQPIKGNVLDLRDVPNGCKFAPRCPLAFDKCPEVKPVLTATKGSHGVACHLYT